VPAREEEEEKKEWKKKKRRSREHHIAMYSYLISIIILNKKKKEKKKKRKPLIDMGMNELKTMCFIFSACEIESRRRHAGDSSSLISYKYI
jgi:hypothetical protein